ncbi:MAG: dihydrofolate reductase family protein [Gemmatimonadaceae bacterium]
MKKVILQEFVSLDGFAADSKGGVDFVPAASKGDQSFGRRQLEFMDTVDTILLGRVTYEMFAGYWPNVTSGDDKEFADRINAMRKIVFSSTLEKAPWGAWLEGRIVRGPAEEAVPRLKHDPGKNMVLWGSISLAQSLLRSGLVDELQLIVCPTALGSGKRLIAEELEPGAVSLAAVHSFDRGNVLLSYEVSSAVSAGHVESRQYIGARH